MNYIAFVFTEVPKGDVPYLDTCLFKQVSNQCRTEKIDMYTAYIVIVSVPCSTEVQASIKGGHSLGDNVAIALVTGSGLQTFVHLETTKQPSPSRDACYLSKLSSCVN